jgi:hypothetical protein
MARPDSAVLPLPLLRRRARRTYEVARLRRAFLGAWPVPLAALLGLRLGCSHAHVLALAAPLLLLSMALLWVGKEYGRGVWPGLGAGIAPLVLPGLTLDCAAGCSPGALHWCQVSCIAGGVLAGLAVGWRAARLEAGSLRFGVVAAGIALLTGAIGCLLGGAVGVVGMVLGFALGAVPALVLVPSRSA